MSSKYDFHIPVPPAATRADANPLVAMLREMPVGGSRFEVVDMAKAMSAVKSVTRRFGGRFTVRKTTEMQAHGVRFWRLVDHT